MKSTTVICLVVAMAAVIDAKPSEPVAGCQKTAVVPGDGSIIGCDDFAAKHGTTFAQLLEYNRYLRSDCANLDIGNEICIEGPRSSSSPSSSPSPSLKSTTATSIDTDTAAPVRPDSVWIPDFSASVRPQQGAAKEVLINNKISMESTGHNQPAGFRPSAIQAALAPVNQATGLGQGHGLINSAVSSLVPALSKRDGTRMMMKTEMPLPNESKVQSGAVTVNGAINLFLASAGILCVWAVIAL